MAQENAPTIINQADVPRRHAPVIETGVIGWIRHNLFNSVFDSVLTILSILLIFSVVRALVDWIVTDANWFAVTRNLTNLMVDALQSQPGAIDRVNLMTLILAFGVGISLRAWSRIGFYGWLTIAIAALLIVVIPPLFLTIPKPAAALMAGNIPVVSGSVTEMPRPETSFTGVAGEVIRIRVAQDEGASDAALANVATFADRASSALMITAGARRAAQTEIANLEAALATNPDDEALAAELEALRASNSQPATELYALNTTPVQLQIIAADGVTVLAEGTVSAGSPEFSYTLPESGWYILSKMVDVEGADVLLFADNIYPSIERNISQPRLDENGQPMFNARGAALIDSIKQHVRVTDDMIIEGDQPRRDGVDVFRHLFVDNQYRGDRPLTDYLSLHVGPFVERAGRLLLPCIALFALGYAFAHLFDLSFRSVARSVTSTLRPVGRSLGSAWTAATAPFNTGAARLGLGNAYPLVLLWRLIRLIPRSIGLLIQSVYNFFFSPLPPDTRPSRRLAARMWLIMPIIVALIIASTNAGLWGGLFLTFLLTAVGIVVSFPIGILLALGRRADNLPVVKYFCIAFIELVRGVPLVTVLFLASLTLPLINSSLQTVPGAIRAMIAITIFSAAYLAENVRGGLQSIASGQTEAAKALGMNPVQITTLITLPQALRAVIPALVGQCISLFKDTSLVAIIGLADLTRVADTTVAQAEYIGLRREVYLFIAVIYFVFSYVMGYVSRKLEDSGSGSARQTKL